MKIKLTIEYEGTRFSGWQRQASRLTVQEKIEDALFRMFHKKVVIFGASRTDAGVHAEGQVAHFSPPQELPKIDYSKALNSLLPRDIRVLSAEKVSDDFHAQKNAKSKLYEYYILNQGKPSALHRSFSWWRAEEMNIEAMNEASQYLVGEHDFASFQSSGSQVKTSTRTVLEAHWRREEGFLIFGVRGTGFLKYMIRNIVGTICLVGSHKITPLDFKNILGKKNRSQAGPTAPANGLVLKQIYY